MRRQKILISVGDILRVWGEGREGAVEMSSSLEVSMSLKISRRLQVRPLGRGSIQNVPGIVWEIARMISLFSSVRMLAPPE